MKILSKKSYYFWLINLILLFFTACGTLHQAPYPADDTPPPPPPPPSICGLLKADVLEVSEKKDSRVTVTYELVNISDLTIEKLYNECKLLFLIKTMQGTQIAHTENLYGSITAESSIIKEVKILLSTYDIDEVEVKIMKK